MTNEFDDRCDKCGRLAHYSPLTNGVCAFCTTRNDRPNPYQVTRDFERLLCQYTGAPFAVAVNSCSAALLLAVQYFCGYTKGMEVEIPKHTYISVPMSIIHAGAWPTFRDEQWRGAYQLKPLPVWDCARRFTSGMYVPGQFQCISLAANKILGIEQGGAILHDHAGADEWFRRMRFDGRAEGVDPAEDTFPVVGHHCLMLPSIAAQALLRLYHFPQSVGDMPDYPYPDLSKLRIFKR